MVKFSVLVPEATVNYITNPALRYDTTGWNTFGSTITRDLNFARIGIASLKVVTTGAVLREGAFFRVSSLSGVNEPITISIYVRGAGKVRIRLDNNVVGGTEFSSQTVTLDPDRWQRISMTGFSTGGNDLRLYVETDDTAVISRTFYIDGAQLERKAYITTYCDGDQEGCRWNGLYHGSTSQRSATTRAGGKWTQLAGDEREAQDLYMTVVNGLGNAPMTNNLQNFALAPGASFQGNRIGVRPITLTFFAKHLITDGEEPVSLGHLHQLRQTLIDLVKPDLTGGEEELIFEYNDGTIPLYFKARYDGGLEGEWDIRNQFVNSFPLKLICVSPFLQEDNQAVSVLDIQNSILMNFVFGRINGQWDRLNYGFNGQVSMGAIGPKGQIYMGGQFSVVNNNASATDPLRTARVAYWDGSQWNAIATSLGGNAIIYCIAVAANGDVYVGGDFTSVNGVAANFIAKYTTATATWSALGTGMNALVQCIALAPNGDVYAGGNFTTAGGTTVGDIARWDGLQWRVLGQYQGVNGAVISIAITKDGSTLYCGGNFTRERGSVGVTITSVAQYNISTGLFSAMGNGLTAVSGQGVYMLYISDAGIVYAGGAFVLSGTDTVNHIAQWTGSNWVALGAGLDSTVYDIKGLSNNNLIAVGLFNNSGSIPVSKIALWNGSTWTLFDNSINVTPTDNASTVVVDKNNDDVYLGMGSNIGTNKQLLFSGITTVSNPGTAEVNPVIYAQGPGSLKWIENQTTGKRIYLNLNILSGEEVFFDFGRASVISTVRGNLMYGVLAGSDFHSFTLLPGNNTLAVMVIGDVGAQMQIACTPQHWSVDATQRDVS